jgi:hypothetical protein
MNIISKINLAVPIGNPNVFSEKVTLLNAGVQNGNIKYSPKRLRCVKNRKKNND